MAKAKTEAAPIVTAVEGTHRLADLKPHPKNARKHSAEEVDQLKALILEFGWTSRILLDEDLFILAGHRRVLAGQAAGHVEGPTLQLFGLTDQQKRRLMLADNRVAMNGSWDEDALRSELLQLRGDGVDLAALGFGAADLDKLTPAELVPAVSEVDVSAVQDRFWISVRGPLASQAQALQRLKDVMKEIPGVAVEQGTVAVG